MMLLQNALVLRVLCRAFSLRVFDASRVARDARSLSVALRVVA